MIREPRPLFCFAPVGLLVEERRTAVDIQTSQIIYYYYNPIKAVNTSLIIPPTRDDGFRPPKSTDFLVRLSILLRHSNDGVQSLYFPAWESPINPPPRFCSFHPPAPLYPTDKSLAASICARSQNGLQCSPVPRPLPRGHPGSGLRSESSSRLLCG